MRKRLIRLTLAVAALAATQLGLFAAPAAEAACPTFCCPGTSICYTCCRPCPIQCP